MASFLLIDDSDDSKPPTVRVVCGEDYRENADALTIDYLNWSKVGDVLRLCATQHLVRLGTYSMSIGQKSEKKILSAGTVTNSELQKSKYQGF